MVSFILFGVLRRRGMGILMFPMGMLILSTYDHIVKGNYQNYDTEICVNLSVAKVPATVDFIL